MLDVYIHNLEEGLHTIEYPVQSKKESLDTEVYSALVITEEKIYKCVLTVYPGDNYQDIYVKEANPYTNIHCVHR